MTITLKNACNLHSDLTMELPFTLTHPEPEHKVICGMVTLPRRKSSVKPADNNTDQQTDNTATGNQKYAAQHKIIIGQIFSKLC